MGKGIVVGADQTQEWLLPWWWDHYQKHNSYPVAFIDFGLSSAMKSWCRQRGRLIRLPLSDLFVKEKEEIEPELVEKWEKYYGENFWYSRASWFKKPHACLLSPFAHSIWLDLDCEVLGSLQPLFAFRAVALAKDQIVPSTYNSGVIVFEQGHSLMREWAHQSTEKNGNCRGDQDLLSQIIREQGFAIQELPQIYNWNVGFGIPPDMVICHWLGERGKQALRYQLLDKD